MQRPTYCLKIKLVLEKKLHVRVGVNQEPLDRWSSALYNSEKRKHLTFFIKIIKLPIVQFFVQKFIAQNVFYLNMNLFQYFVQRFITWDLIMNNWNENKYSRPRQPCELNIYWHTTLRIKYIEIFFNETDTIRHYIFI